MPRAAGERADLRLEEGREEERVARQLDALDPGVRRVGRDHHARGLEPGDVRGRQPEVAEVEAGEGAVPQIAASRVPGTQVTSRSSPTSEHARGATNGSSAPGSASALAAGSPARRASAIARYWKPPQVPSSGVPSSIARSSAASTASSSS